MVLVTWGLFLIYCWRCWNVHPYQTVSVRRQQGERQYKALAWPWGVSTVRLPRASWSFSMASKRDLKFPAPKPWRENRHTQMANYPEICRLLCHSLWLWGFFSQMQFTTLMLDNEQRINILTGFKRPHGPLRWGGGGLRSPAARKINHVNIFIGNQKDQVLVVALRDSLRWFGFGFLLSCIVSTSGGSLKRWRVTRRACSDRQEWAPGVINWVPQGATQSKDPPHWGACEPFNLCLW